MESKLYNIQTFTVDRKEILPIVCIENVYDEDELNLIWRELEFLTSKEKLYDKERTAGTSLKKNKGLFLDDAYSDRNISDILRLNRKIFSDPTIHEEILKISPIFRGIETSNYDMTLISYYENGDEYGSHVDFSTYTAITFFYKEPKSFEGGNLIFDDYDLNIEIKNNMCVIFLSCLFHKVTEVKMKESKFNGTGRYSMSQFICQSIENR